MALRLRSLALLLPIGTCLAGMASCSAPSKGSIILAISTDMVTPKDINVVSVLVENNSAVKFDYIGRVLPDGTVALPATLAVVEPDNPDDQIHIRITAFQERKARVLRDVVTTVPHGRTSLLRLPLNLLDDGSVTGQLPVQYVPIGANAPQGAPEGNTEFIPTDPTIITDTCKFLETGKTMINGECKDSTVESTKLADFQEKAVYGAGGMLANGTPASCFDVAQCFAGATPVAGMSMTGCSFPLPQGADPAKLNLALATTDGTGLCTPSGQCFVPLVYDPSGPTGDGWYVNGRSVEMIAGICMKMLGTGAKLYQVQGSCDARTLSDPVCEPTTVAEVRALLDGGGPQDASTTPDAASDAGVKDGGAPVVDAGSDGGTSPCAAGQIYCSGACVPGPTCNAPGDGGSDATSQDASLGCVSDTQCGGAAPHCNTQNGACVQCVTTAQCTGGAMCSTATFTCVSAGDAGSDGATDGGVVSDTGTGG